MEKINFLFLGIIGNEYFIFIYKQIFHKNLNVKIIKNLKKNNKNYNISHICNLKSYCKI